MVLLAVFLTPQMCLKMTLKLVIGKQGLDSQAKSLHFIHKETLRISNYENNTKLMLHINVAYFTYVI